MILSTVCRAHVHKNINAPLILIVCEVIFCMLAKHNIGYLSSFVSRYDNLGVKSLGRLEKPLKIADYVFWTLKKITFARFQNPTIKQLCRPADLHLDWAHEGHFIRTCTVVPKICLSQSKATVSAIRNFLGEEIWNSRLVLDCVIPDQLAQELYYDLKTWFFCSTG